MAKLVVKPALIFGDSLAAAGNIETFGSYKAGAASYSKDPALIQNANWLLGIFAGLIDTGGGQNSPVWQDFNGILYALTYNLAKYKQDGLLEYDATVEYYAGSWTQVAGVPYISQQNANIGNDPTVPGSPYWSLAAKVLGTTAGSPKAWVVFDGRSGAIDSAFNVASVTRESAGTYLVSFTTPLASAFYGLAGSCGTRPGVGFINGDDNIITAGCSGRTPIRTTAQCRVFAFDRSNQGTEDSSMISVNFFGP